MADEESSLPESSPTDVTPEPARNCLCSDSCYESLGVIENGQLVMITRFIGAIAIAFSVVEFALGGATYNTLTNRVYGAWWASFLAFAGGVTAIPCKNRAWVTAACILTSLAFAVALIGAIIDGIGSESIGRLTTCTTYHAAHFETHSYGKGNHTLSDECIVSAYFMDELVSDKCYCATSTGTCRDFTLTWFADRTNMNCGTIMTTYLETLKASSAFCAAVSAIALVLSILTCVILSKKVPKRLDRDDLNPNNIIGINGNENTF